MTPSSVLHVVCLALTLPGLALAQQPSPTGGAVPAADLADVRSVDAIVAALYDVISGPAGAPRDWDRFRSLFLPEARLTPTGVRPDDGSAWARYLTTEDYIGRSGPVLEGRGFVEQEIGRITERFENIAHAFSTYESRWTPEGDVFQRGINSIQLLWDGERWWIVNIMWRGVRAEEEIPARYLRRP